MVLKQLPYKWLAGITPCPGGWLVAPARLAAVRAHLEVTLSLSQFASASIRNFNQLPQPMRERSVALRQEYGTIWKTLFDDAAKSGTINASLDVVAARMLVIGALNSMIEWWDSGRQTEQQVIEHAQDFVYNALAPR